MKPLAAANAASIGGSGRCAFREECPKTSTRRLLAPIADRPFTRTPRAGDDSGCETNIAACADGTFEPRSRARGSKLVRYGGKTRTRSPSRRSSYGAVTSSATKTSKAKSKEYRESHYHVARPADCRRRARPVKTAGRAQPRIAPRAPANLRPRHLCHAAPP